MNSYQDTETALETAYEQYADMLYRLSLSRLGNSQDAEDAVQEVFIKYLDSCHKFKDADHERAWLVRVTINCCLDIIRRKKKQSNVSLDDLAEIPGKFTDLTEGLRVLNLCSDLPSKIAAVVILHYLEGYPVKDVAKMLGISLSATKMRLSRGRSILQKNMAKGE